MKWLFSLSAVACVAVVSLLAAAQEPAASPAAEPAPASEPAAVPEGAAPSPASEAPVPEPAAPSAPEPNPPAAPEKAAPPATPQDTAPPAEGSPSDAAPVAAPGQAPAAEVPAQPPVAEGNASPESPAAPAEAAVEPAEITGLLIAPEVLVLHQDVVPVDVRPAEAYAAGHLPGAVSLPAAALSEERGGVQNLLKPVDQLAAILAERGMTTERRYVIYGGNTSATEVQAATRVFWVLEYLSFPSVYLLDGGYARWTAEGRPVAQGPYTPSPIPVESVKLVIRPEVIARRSEVIDMVGNGKGVLVDTRMPSFYAGAEKKDFVARAGHIPGAVNLPADPMLTGPDFRFRAMEEIRAGFTTGSDDPLERIVVYCNSGNTASLGYFLFRLQGKENVAVYDGSMAEWARNPALNVVTEPVPEAAPAQPESGAAPAGEAVSAPQPEPSQPADAVQPTPSDATPDSSAPAVPPAETGGADAQPPAAPPAESGQPAPEGASAEQPSQEPAPVESAPAPEQTSQPAEAEPAPPSADAQQPNPAPPDPQSQQ